METLIIHTENNKVELVKQFLQSLKISFEVKKESYDSSFVEKIKKSTRDKEEGKGRTTTLEELNALWK